MNAKKNLTEFFSVICILFLFAANAGAQNYGEWSALLGKNDAWFASDAQAITVGDQIVSYQLPDGGWRKDHATTSGEWAKSTVDNEATTSQIQFLAKLIKNRPSANSKYLTALNKGLDLFFNGQYSNGGFPQIFSASSGSYHTHITFNDGAMIRIMNILYDVTNKSGNFTFYTDNTRIAKAKTAVEKGVDVILKSQIVFTNGTKTAWCQQHDKGTLAPASARAYELPSVSGSESVGIVNFLKRYHTSLGSSPRADVVQAINAAVTWMTNVKIVGKKVNNITTNGSADRVLVDDPSSTIWARFYELNTNKPIFVGRDGVKKYNMADIEQERRAGYAWYGNWPKDLVNAGLMTVPNTTPSSSSVTGSSSSSVPANTPPTASITAPADNSTSLPGVAISIKASAADANGTVSKVEFFNGDTKLGEDSSYPYEFSWTNPPAGTHLIRARATDNGGAIGESQTVMVTVGAAISGASDFIENLVTFDPDNAEYYSINKNFGSGSKLFGDREFAVGPSVSANLQGAEWVSPSIQTRRITFPTVIQFKMKKDGFVNLLLEDRVENSEKKPTWLTSAGFTATNSKISATGDSQDRTFTIYTKTVKQGDEIKLGANSSDGFTSCFMYLVVFTEENKPPTVSVSAPAAGSVFVPGQTINIAATASAASGAITKVEFFAGATKLGEKTAPPYTYDWTNAPSGVHSITVSTTDNLGATSASDAVTIIVGASIASTGSFFDKVVLFDPANAEAWSVEQNFDIGSKVFGDREFVAASIPSELLGAEWISTSMETRRLTSPATFIQFEVTADGTLNLLFEDRIAEKPAWVAEAGFVATEQKVVVTGDGSENGRAFTIYTKSVSSGDIIAMGLNSNNGTSLSMMYLVAFTSEETVPILSKTPSNLTHFSLRQNGKILLIEANSSTFLDIFDLNGKKVASYNILGGSQNLHLSLKNGVYFAVPRGMQGVKFVVK